MTNKKLPDSEIIKALECCKSNTSLCNECPYDKIGECIEKLCSDSIDLINRLQEEKEALINGQETLQKYIAEQKAEVERLKPFENKIAGFNSHIRVEDMLVFASSLEEWLEFCDNLKAEAYKECIEKVKETSNKTEWDCNGALVQTDYTISEKKLDNLLKELVGDGNAEEKE